MKIDWEIVLLGVLVVCVGILFVTLVNGTSIQSGYANTCIEHGYAQTLAFNGVQYCARVSEGVLQTVPLLEFVK